MVVPDVIVIQIHVLLSYCVTTVTGIFVDGVYLIVCAPIVIQKVTFRRNLDYFIRLNSKYLNSKYLN